MTPADRQALLTTLLLVHLPLALLGGTALTAFVALTPSSWTFVLGARVAWVMVAAATAAAGLVRVVGDEGWQRVAYAVVMLALGALTQWHPLADLVGGPRVVDGVLHFTVERGHLQRNTGASPTMATAVTVTTIDGNALDIEPTGMQANRWLAMVSAAQVNDGDRVHLTALEHVDVVLAVKRSVL